MAIAHVQSPAGIDTTGTSANISYGSNVTAGSLLVGAARLGNGGASTWTVTDSLGQTWLTAIKRDVASHGNIIIAYFPNSIAGANTVTFAHGFASTSMRLTVSEYSGAATSSPVGATASADGEGSPTSGHDIITALEDSLIYSICSTNAAALLAADAAFTLRVVVPSGGTVNRLGSQDKILVASGTFPNAWTGPTAQSGPDWAAAAAEFKIAGGGGGGDVLMAQACL